MCVAVIIYSCVLVYHWVAYGKSPTATFHTLIIYFIGVALLLGSMAFALLKTFN